MGSGLQVCKLRTRKTLADIATSNDVARGRFRYVLRQAAVIGQFGLIKIIPGVVNILLVPYLVWELGNEQYGTYSLMLSYAMLIATVLGAIVTQPMYRFLASTHETSADFCSLAVVIGGCAAIASFSVLGVVGTPIHFSAGLSLYVLGTVLFAAVSVWFQIRLQMGRLAIFEGLRVVTLVIVVALPKILDQQLAIGHVITGLILSTTVPLILFAPRQRLVKPQVKWLLDTLSFGGKSASWLLLAGLPIVLGKTYLSATLTATTFGTYSAIADFLYRGFGLWNAAVIMWAFPRLSRLFDAKDFKKTRATLYSAIALYLGLGVLAIVALTVIAADTTQLKEHLPGGIATFALISLAYLAWHGMSVCHKPFELCLRTTRMLCAMAIAVLGFGVLVTLGHRLEWAEPIPLIHLNMLLIACFYCWAGLSQRLGGQNQNG